MYIVYAYCKYLFVLGVSELLRLAEGEGVFYLYAIASLAQR